MTLNPECLPGRTSCSVVVDDGVWKGASLIELSRSGLIADNKSKVSLENQNEASSNSNFDEKTSTYAVEPTPEVVPAGGCECDDASNISNGSSSIKVPPTLNVLKLDDNDKLHLRAASEPAVSQEHEEELRAVGRELRMIADEFDKSASLRIPFRRRCYSMVVPKPRSL